MIWMSFPYFQGFPMSLTRMNHQSPVPLHLLLQQPLFIDTDISYNLDMSKFPGLDDPQQMYEPALLVAKQPERALDHSRERIQCHTAKPSCADDPVEPPKDVLEELLNIIDTCSIELLDRLIAAQDQPTKQGMNRSINNTCSSVPYNQAFTRNQYVPNKKNPFVS